MAVVGGIKIQSKNPSQKQTEYQQSCISFKSPKSSPKLTNSDVQSLSKIGQTSSPDKSVKSYPKLTILDAQKWTKMDVRSGQSQVLSSEVEKGLGADSRRARTRGEGFTPHIRRSLSTGPSRLVVPKLEGGIPPLDAPLAPFLCIFCLQTSYFAHIVFSEHFFTDVL